MFTGTRGGGSRADTAAEQHTLEPVVGEEGISRGTLAKWRAEARAKGKLMPEADAHVEGWTSRDKLAAVIEAAALNVSVCSCPPREPAASCFPSSSPPEHP